MKAQQLLTGDVTRLAAEHRRLLQLFGRRREQQEEAEEEAYFVDYVPPARDAINLPPNVIYVLVGLVLVVIATYAIVGHLIKDLMHDLAGNPLPPDPLQDPHPPTPSVWRSSPSRPSSLMNLFLCFSPSLFFLFLG